VRFVDPDGFQVEAVHGIARADEEGQPDFRGVNVRAPALPWAEGSVARLAWAKEYRCRTRKRTRFVAATLARGPPVSPGRRRRACVGRFGEGVGVPRRYEGIGSELASWSASAMQRC
jgi:hypothetical protein